MLCLIVASPASTVTAQSPEDVLGTSLVTFSPPEWHVLVQSAADQAQRLYRTGDAIFDPADASHSFIIEDIEADFLRLGENPGRRSLVLHPGHSIPGMPGLVVLRTLPVDQLAYRVRVVGSGAQPDPVLVSINDGKVILEHHVSGVPSLGVASLQRDATPSASKPAAGPATNTLTLHAKQTGTHTYELDKSALLPTVLELAKRITRRIGTITAALASGTTALELDSSVGSGVLTTRGFTITAPKVAEALGVKVGDTVVNLNGQAVSSPLHTWWTFQEIFIRGRTDEMHVHLVRDGQPLTKTYRLR